MRTLSFVVAVMVLSAGAAGAAARHPSLRLLRALPLVVHGSGFQPRELVRVNASDHVAGVVRTTRAGTFRVELGSTAPVDRCSAFAVVARGAHGDAVVLKVRPQCTPP